VDVTDVEKAHGHAPLRIGFATWLSRRSQGPFANDDMYAKCRDDPQRGVGCVFPCNFIVEAMLAASCNP
jgi:hypothetical protein